MKIIIVTIGKPSLKYSKEGIEKYLKLISKFSKVEHKIIEEKKGYEEKILKLKELGYLVLLDEKGKQFTSRELATFLNNTELDNIKNIYFVIGAADGHSQELKNKADILFSMSKLTFAHDLATLNLTETLFRSLSINKGHPYHRD